MHARAVDLKSVELTPPPPPPHTPSKKLHVHCLENTVCSCTVLLWTKTKTLSRAFLIEHMVRLWNGATGFK